MANLAANETSLHTEIYGLKRELEALRDDNYALRCYLKSAEKQVEEVCKKVDFYMDEVKSLRAENEVLKANQNEIRAQAVREALAYARCECDWTENTFYKTVAFSRACEDYADKIESQAAKG